MTLRVTRRQRDVLIAVAAHVRTRGYGPSVRELCATLGMSSTSTIHSHLTRLIVKGLLTRPPHSPRALALTELGRHNLPMSDMNGTHLYIVTLHVQVRAGSADEAVERATVGMGERVHADVQEIIKGGEQHEAHGHGGSAGPGGSAEDDPAIAPGGDGADPGRA